MPILNFPNNPRVGDTYTGDNGISYIWDGNKWGGHTAAIDTINTNSSYLINNGNVVQVDGGGNLVIPVGATILDANGQPVITGGGTGWFITSATSTLTVSNGIIGISPGLSFVFDQNTIGDGLGAALGSGQYEVSQYTATFFVSPTIPMVLGGAGLQLIDYTSGNDGGFNRNTAAAIFVGNTSATGGVEGIQDQNHTIGSVRVQSYNTATTSTYLWTFGSDGTIVSETGRNITGELSGQTDNGNYFGSLPIAIKNASGYKRLVGLDSRAQTWLRLDDVGTQLGINSVWIMGMVIDYQAQSSNFSGGATGSMVGQIIIATNGNYAMSVTHSEAVITQNNSSSDVVFTNLDLWHVNGGTLEAVRTDSNSQQLDIIWTAKVFVNSSEDYC
jgi:hypothetical protein